MPKKLMSLTDVRQRLPAIVDEVIATRRAIVITRHGRPVAQVSPYTATDSASSRYALRDVQLEIPEDFDEPLEAQWEALK